jgi:hypothetical protein
MIIQDGKEVTDIKQLRSPNPNIELTEYDKKQLRGMTLWENIRGVFILVWFAFDTIFYIIPMTIIYRMRGKRFTIKSK